MSLGSLKAFIFEPISKAIKKGSAKDIQQVLFLSGPDPKPVVKPTTTKNSKNEYVSNLVLFEYIYLLEINIYSSRKTSKGRA